MSMIPMPECVETFLNSLTEKEKAAVVRWVNYGRCTEDEIREFLQDSPANQRAAELFARQQSDFMEAARDNVIVSTCIQVARQNNMWIGFAWLSACMALLGQNKVLMENAQMLITTTPLAPLFDPPEFTRTLSPEQKDGYVPHPYLDDIWQESDETFKQRIQKTYGERKP